MAGQLKMMLLLLLLLMMMMMIIMKTEKEKWKKIQASKQAGRLAEPKEGERYHLCQ